mgnify:FL=1
MKELFDRWGIGQVNRLEAAERVTTPNMLIMGGMGGQTYRRRLNRDWKTLLRLSESPIPSRAISLIRDKIMALEYVIQPKPSLESEDFSEEIDTILSVLDNPNTDDEDWSTFIGKIVEDQLVFDAGAWEYVENPAFIEDNEILALESLPGFTIERVKDWSGDPKKPKWVQSLPGVDSIPLLDKQIELLTHRKRTSQVYGFSPLETAIGLMDAWLSLASYQSQVASDAYPAVILSLGETVTEEQIKGFRMYWDQELRGVGRPGIIGNMKNPEAIQMKAISDEGLYPKYYETLIRTLAFTFKLKPQDFGIERDVNRNQGENSQKATTDEAVKPYALLIKRRVNNRVIPRIAQITNNPRIKDLMFDYPNVDPWDALERAKIREIDMKHDVLTIDEARLERGLRKREDGLGDLTWNQYLAQTRSTVSEFENPEEEDREEDEE